MEDPNTAFINKYVQILRAKFDEQLSVAINLEAQLLLTKERVAELEKQVESLRKQESPPKNNK